MIKPARVFLALIIVLFMMGCKNQKQPNIILIMADDLGYGGIGCYGNEVIKTTLYEGGHRLPGIASWPGRIVGGVSGELALSIDLFPTILAVCDIKKPEGMLLDGIDLSPLLFNGEELKKRNVFWRYRGSLSLRKGSMKLLTTSEDTMLFDLSKDLREENNVAADSLDLLTGMLEELNKWDSEMNGYPQKTR